MVKAASNTSSETEPPRFTTPGHRRPLHWVFKVGDLVKTMDFYEKVFGMKVHRHEEFSSGCEATCNGPYGGAWSKTMVGWGPEDTNFALELTCNYGIWNYEKGNDFRYIAVKTSAVKQHPASLGYDVRTHENGCQVVTAPDGYEYMLVDTEEGEATEPFLFVSLNVSSLPQAREFYCQGLGAREVPGGGGTLGTPDSMVLDFVPTGISPGVKLELVEVPGFINHKQASGRYALETEDGGPDKVAKRMEEIGGKVAHGPFKLQPHGEEVVIVLDPDEHEYCFVDARGYMNCISVRESEEGSSIDWEQRERLHAAAALPTEEERKMAMLVAFAGSYDSDSVKQKIDGYAASAPVVVFSQTSCPYCKKAKELLESLGAKYKTVEVDALGKEGYAIRLELNNTTGRSSVPNIFIGGTSVGGFTDGLEQLSIDGKLFGILKENGAI